VGRAAQAAVCKTAEASATLARDPNHMVCGVAAPTATVGRIRALPPVRDPAPRDRFNVRLVPPLGLPCTAGSVTTVRVAPLPTLPSEAARCAQSPPVRIAAIRPGLRGDSAIDAVSFRIAIKWANALPKSVSTHFPKWCNPWVQLATWSPLDILHEFDFALGGFVRCRVGFVSDGR